MITPVYLAFILAFLATVSFGILFQAPRKTLLAMGFIGAVGWVVFIVLRQGMDYTSFNANFIAAFTIAVLSEASARIFKQPTTVYLVPGIIPLVPGLGMYKGMNQIIANNYDLGMSILLTAGTDAGAIALGLMMVASIFRVMKIKSRKI